MPKYRVTVSRISYAANNFEVEARDVKEAKKAALDEAGDYSFREHDADYEVDYVVKL